MIGAYEHHMKVDLTATQVDPAAEVSIFSKIIAVADGFDAATSRRVYQTVPIQPTSAQRDVGESPAATIRWW